VEESISDAIIRIRKKTGWGYNKILQALRRLRHKISRQTVKNVLVEAGLGPEPHDHPDTWSEFIKWHPETMWQCDVACKRKWTVKGMVIDPFRERADSSLLFGLRAKIDF
jgi:putative transposase